MVNRLERHLRIIRNLARILETGRLRPASNRVDGTTETPAARGEMPETPPAPPARPAAAQVKRVVRRYLNRLAQQAPRRGRGAPTGHFVDHLVKVTNRYWSGLFHTYDHPNIPATTNALEGFFGSSKRSLRSTTGRASTAGGKMQSCGEFTISAQCLTRLMPKAELEPHLNGVSYDLFAATKKQLRRLAEPARERRRMQRGLATYLDRSLAVWFGATRGP